MRNNDQGRRFYLSREPVILSALSLLVVVMFVAVTGLSHVFYGQQESLGKRWYNRGVKEMNAGHYQPAVTNFRAALRYARDDYSYQLNLAEALIGQHRFTEASAYLVNLWERQPENGVVNLELARISAQDGKTGQALRYYHNAIYATWPNDPHERRQQARLELVHYLLRMSDRVQAQAELIALAANMADDPAMHVQVGDLFYASWDYEHALTQYTLGLKKKPQDAAALAGAGRAAFQLNRFYAAESYLQSALQARPSDASLATLLTDTRIILQMDPYQRRVSFSQRIAMVQKAFAVAGDRLKVCREQKAASGVAEATGTEAELREQWNRMQRKISNQALRRNPELTDAAMDLAFKIERTMQYSCSPPTPQDRALLQIAKVHQAG
jgi:tetratricopeptide (TPR) repeat protein